jgi:hypothetical protein
MRRCLAAAAAGITLIATAVFVFSLSSHPVSAGTTTVEPIAPSLFVDGKRRCQGISRIPPGADRLQVLVTHVTGGARRLRVKITDRRGLVTAGELKALRAGESRIKLRPRTRAAHPARLCFSNPGLGRITLAGDQKRIPASPPGEGALKKSVAGLIFLRPGSTSWFSQAGMIADRYANAQTGLTGRWSVWLAALLALVASALAIWSMVTRPGRPS